MDNRTDRNPLISSVLGVLGLVICVVVGSLVGSLIPADPTKRYMFTPPQEVVVGIGTFALGLVLRFFCRFALQELLVTAVLAEAAILAVVCSVAGAFSFDDFNMSWTWEVSRFITLPFLVSAFVGMLAEFGIGVYEKRRV